MNICGIDPGLDGAIALWQPHFEELEVIDMPTLKLRRGKSEKREIDCVQLAHIFDNRKIHRAFLERVGSRPGEGVSSAFNFGMSFGICRMAASAHFIPVDLVTPQKWKAFHGIKPGAGKDASRAKASQILPQFAPTWARVKDDGRAEAVLIALFGASLA